MIKNPKPFADFLQLVADVYEKLEDYNRANKRKVLKVFNDMIADMEANKKLSPIVNESSLRERNLKISIVFISQSYFKVPKDIRLNVTHYFILEIANKKELQQIASNNSSGNEFKDFMKFYKDYAK